MIPTISEIPVMVIVMTAAEAWTSAWEEAWRREKEEARGREKEEARGREKVVSSSLSMSIRLNIGMV